MTKIGVWIETGEQGVKEPNFGVLTAARQLEGAEVYAFLSDARAEDCKNVLQPYGAQKIVEIAVDGGDPAADPELKASALAEAVKHFEISALLGLSSAKGRELLARTAASMEVPLIQDCMGVDLAARTVIKSHFSGRTIATIRFNSNPYICGLRPNAIEPQTAPCEAEVLNFNASAHSSGKLLVKEVKQSPSRGVDLTEANIIITGGRPIASAENYKILRECAELLGAAVGASRAAVDAGFAPHSMPNRQNRQSQTLHRLRAFRVGPAFCRHENRQGHRRDQHRQRRPDFRQMRLRHRGRSVRSGAGVDGSAQRARVRLAELMLDTGCWMLDTG